LIRRPRLATFINDRLISIARQQNALIVHPHCQRTGGGMFRKQVLARVFGEDRIYSRLFISDAKRWSRLKEADLAGFSVYSDLHNYVDIGLTRPHVAVALVRDPVYRAVALYHFVRRTAGHRHHLLANQLGLEEFYRRASSRDPTYFRNVQCRRICGRGDASRALAFIDTHYIGVGFMAELDLFVRVLCQALRWPSIELKSNQPDSERYGAELTPRFRETVLADNREDQDLFEVLSVGPPFGHLGRSLKRHIQAWATESRDLSLAALSRLTGPHT